ncbi:MAG: CusA/CzcA family heavy metal efflux RND transporter [Candidatus Omnitrophota bacterium]
MFIEKIVTFSVRNKSLIFMLTAAAIITAVWSIKNIPLDAIPDLSDTQVIIYSRWDKSPDLVEDQVTYPIISSLLGAPNVKSIRGFSDFGFSYVYVIFKDGTDIYWARSRVTEYLSKILPRLPEGVKTELGPDATGVGWVFQYALVDKSGKHDLQELRSFQDWSLRYHLQSVPGVAEVASLGGFVKQYQITVDPKKLLAYNIPLTDVMDAVRSGNEEAGGRLLEFSGTEYMVRSHGLAKTIKDFEDIVLKTDANGTPILIKDVARVALGPEMRRGIADLNGEGDVVTGTIVMRYGENALTVINRVKEKIKELKSSFPEGVELKVLYDRSDLIQKAIDTLKHQLVEEMLIVSLIIIIFLWHFPSAFVPIVTIPVAVLLSFIPFYGLKLTANIMSLSGIAISIGVLVDGAIVQVENAYKRLEEWKANGRNGDFHAVLLNSITEIAPSVFFSLLVVAVSFMPIFTLVDQEGRLFKPLAWTKNLSMLIAAVLAITLDPALRFMFTRMDPIQFKKIKWPFVSKIATTLAVGNYYPEEKHPVSRFLFKCYDPVCRFVLRKRKLTLIAALVLGLATIPIYMRLGSEFMPPLWEGSILYMPTTLPGISVTQAQKLLQEQDKILKSFPEVESVFGKAGRMESSTDPAPFSMMETAVILKPQNEWRKINGRLLSHEQLISEMDAALKIPGTTNAWTMPIKNRLDMLSTGVRTPVGIKILGDDTEKIEEIGTHIEMILRNVKGVRSIYAERAAGGYFLDFDLKRTELARYGLSVKDAQMIVTSAIGGENITETIEGRQRYPVNVRYPRELRDDPEELANVLIATPSGQQIPLSYIADIVLRTGPAMIRNENGMLAGYVYVDVANRDIGSFVDEAKKIVSGELKLPKGYGLLWSGQYENMIRVKERLKVVIPLTIFIICLLLYFNTKSWIKTGIVLLAVPFSLIGAVWLLWILGYNISIATWVGMIALMGLDAETGVFMLLFLDLSYKDAVAKGKMRHREDLEEAIVHGAVKRIRPKMMTVAAAFMGLLPIMWATGAGSDMMRRVAAPMVGGLASSFILELLIYPVVYFIWKWHSEVKAPQLR